MAAIDKTYVTKSQYKQAVDWCRKTGAITLENGYVFNPIDIVNPYTDSDLAAFSDKDEITLWNTPQWFDRVLWLGCPLDFIRKRLQEQYSPETLKEFETWKYEEHLPGNQHYTVLKKPEGTYWKAAMKRCIRRNWGGSKRMEMNVTYNDEPYGYDEQTDQWYPMFGMLPAYNEYLLINKKKNGKYKQTLTVKSVIRLLRHWWFPPGTVINIRNFRFTGFDYIIKVK